MVSSSTAKGKSPNDIDAALQNALNKLEVSQKEKVPEIVKKPQINSPEATDSGLDNEVDRMLSEFSKMMPGETGDALKVGSRSSREQIEESFKKLMQDPMGLEEGGAFNGEDVDLGELGDMNKIIEQMMGELTSREILYEPFSEMISKYPAWIRENELSIDSELVKNYRGQLTIATQVISIFDREDYPERKAEYQMEIFELMQGMQEFGAPPEGLLASEPPIAGSEDSTGAGEGLTEEERAALPNCNQM